MPFKGPSFAWCNNRNDDSFTKKRLGRVMTNEIWPNMFSHVEVLVLPTRMSNHCHLLLKVKGTKSNNSRTKVYRFEVAWDLNEDNKKIVDNV